MKRFLSFFYLLVVSAYAQQLDKCMTILINISHGGDPNDCNTPFPTTGVAQLHTLSIGVPALVCRLTSRGLLRVVSKLRSNHDTVRPRSVLSYTVTWRQYSTHVTTVYERSLGVNTRQG